MSPIYEYVCDKCGFNLEELLPVDKRDGHNIVCPECHGDFRRVPSIFSDARPTGFKTTGKILPPKVLSESGQLAKRVSDTDLTNIDQTKTNSTPQSIPGKKGPPNSTPEH